MDWRLDHSVVVFHVTVLARPRLSARTLPSPVVPKANQADVCFQQEKKLAGCAGLAFLVLQFRQSSRQSPDYPGDGWERH